MRVARLAAEQHAMVSAAQAFALGLTYDAIRHRVDHGLWTRVHRGVFLVGPVMPPLGPESAGVLACAGSQLFGFTSAAMWGFAERLDAVHVLAPTRRRSRPGLVVHHGVIDAADVRTRQNLPVPSPYTTLVQLRTQASDKAFKHAVWEASYLRLITGAQAEELTGATPVGGSNPSERELVALVLEAGLPAPLTNQKVAGFDVDLYWPDQRVAVEFDGRRAHTHLYAVDRDRRKDLALRTLGIDLIRVGGAQLATESLAVVAVIARALG